MKVKRDRKQKKPLLKVKKDRKTGESSLKKAVKNVKQLLLKKKDIIKKEIKNEVETKPSQVIKKSKSLIKIKGVKGIKGVKKEDKQPIIKADRPKIKKERGVIYIGHVPHGFYEEEMKGYFSQFGKVTKVRLSRSSKSGRSKGYAFVEFLMPEVAKIAAESMNNYLMNGRLVKAEYIPPEKQHKHYFKGPEWSASRFPTLINRKKTISKHNAPKPNKTHKHTVKKSIKYLSKISEKLKQQGIDLGMKIGDVKL